MKDSEFKLIGAQIKQARKAKKLTSDALAKQCKANPDYIRTVQSGSKLPGHAIFIRICIITGKDPNFFYSPYLSIPQRPEDTLDKMVAKMTKGTRKKVTQIIAIVFPELVQEETNVMKQIETPYLIGNQMKRARVAANLTIDEVAAHCDVSQSFLYLVEAGEKMLGYEKFMKFCRITGKDPNFFYSPYVVVKEGRVDRLDYMVAQMVEDERTRTAQLLSIVYPRLIPEEGPTPPQVSDAEKAGSRAEPATEPDAAGEAVEQGQDREQVESK